MRVGDPAIIHIPNKVGEIHKVHPKQPGQSGRIYTVGKLSRVKIESDIEIDKKFLVSKYEECTTYDLYPIHCFGERFRECRRKVAILRPGFSLYENDFIGYCTKHYAWYKAKQEGFKTKPEAELDAILKELFGERFEFAGTYPTVEGKWKPDFIDENNKLIIELFGDYWHSEQKRGITVEQHVQERVDLFESHGYKTLIIWENDLKNWVKVKSKILSFVKKHASTLNSNFF